MARAAAKKTAGKKAPPKKVRPVKSPFRQWADRDNGVAISELCQFIAAGGHLAGFIKEKGFVYTTTLLWITSDAHRAEMYAHAREDRADVLADEIVAIADEVVTTVRAAKHGTKDEDGDGNTEVVFDATAVARNKLRVDARKWAASKLKPRVYGEKLAIGGAPDLPPMQHMHSMSEDELLRIAGQAK